MISTIIMAIATAIMAIATIALAVFNYQLVGISKEMKIAASEAAEASKQSADAAIKSAAAADLALKADRPYLLVEGAELFGFKPDLTSFLNSLEEAAERGAATIFAFKNYGKGPALIDNVLMKLKAISMRPAPKDFSDCVTRDIEVNALSPGAELKILTDLRDGEALTKNDLTSVLNGSKTLIAYGCIQYRDVFNNVYETGFSWAVVTHNLLRALGFPDSVTIRIRRDVNDPEDKDRNYNT